MGAPCKRRQQSGLGSPLNQPVPHRTQIFRPPSSLSCSWRIACAASSGESNSTMPHPCRASQQEVRQDSAQHHGGAAHSASSSTPRQHACGGGRHLAATLGPRLAQHVGVAHRADCAEVVLQVLRAAGPSKHGLLAWPQCAEGAAAPIQAIPTCQLVLYDRLPTKIRRATRISYVSSAMAPAAQRIQGGGERRRRSWRRRQRRQRSAAWRHAAGACHSHLRTPASTPPTWVAVMAACEGNQAQGLHSRRARSCA